MSVRSMRTSFFVSALAFLVTIVLVVPLHPSPVSADVANPICPAEDVHFNPGAGQDIVVPAGFKVSVFKAGLNGAGVRTWVAQPMQRARELPRWYVRKQ